MSVKGQKLEEKKLVDGKLAVRKDGGDVDALTAATISSRAYVDAVSRAYKAYCEKAGVEAAVNTVSGASNTQNAGADGTSGASATRDAERMVRPVLRTIKKRERKPRRARRLLGRMQRLGRELRVKSGIESGDWSVRPFQPPPARKSDREQCTGRRSK